MFCNLHVHDAKGSLLDSILTVPQLVQFAKDNGQKAIALTNHGYMTSFVDFVKECNKQDIKPIIGNEVYEVDDMTEMEDTKDYKQPRYHLVLLAKNEVGFHNLMDITSAACTTGMYKKPRIDLNYIKENNLSEGIICLTGCQAGRLSKYLVNGRDKDAVRYINKLNNIFDNVYCEIQSHNTPEQKEANEKILKFAKANNMPWVITTDAHMLSPEVADSHAIFVQIGEGREVGETYKDCYLQTENNVFSTLGGQLCQDDIKIGIKNTEAISDIIENIDIGLGQGNQMPKIEIDPKYGSHVEYLKSLVFSTFDEKFGDMSQEEQDTRRDRLNTELDVLEYVDYIDYFIMLYMLAQEADNREIPRGYSRGSGANCLCLFMLGVTQIDSVRWNLDFSRFANKGRKSLADFDWDIAKDRRKEMVTISEDLFGKKNVAPICTFNTLSTKVAINDIGKVLDENEDSPYYGQIPYSLRNSVREMIPTIKTLNDLGEEEEKDLLLKDLLKKNKKLNAVYEQFPLWFKHVMVLEGLPKSMGRHAAGTLITPLPVTSYCPLCMDTEKNQMVQLEMHNAMEDLGLVKMDYLGLEALTYIDNALKMAHLTWKDVDINHIDLSDKRVYNEVYKSGNTVGIFQMESQEATNMLRNVRADNIEDVIAVNAANRPGTKDSFPEYISNKLDPDNMSVINNDLKDIFALSHGTLLYQEQALQIFRYAGFPEDEVDNARRCLYEKSLILMENGDLKPLNKVKVGDRVISFDDNRVTSNSVTKIFDNGMQDTYRIETKNRYFIKATADHKFLTQDGWKKLKDLTLDDYIMTPLRINPTNDLIPSNKKPYDEIMYMLGLLIGDGSIGDINGIHFTNSEELLIDRFKECCQKLLPQRKDKCTFRMSEQNGTTVDRIYTVYINHVNYLDKLKKVLVKYGMVHKAGEKCVPKEFMNYSKSDKLSSFLGGLYNTDGGYLELNNSIEYFTKSKKLAYQLKSLLMKYKIYSYISRQWKEGYNYYIYDVVINDFKSVNNFINWINPFVIGRKHDDYQRMLDKRNENKYAKLQKGFLYPEKYTRELNSQAILYGVTQNEIADTLDGYDTEGSFKIPHSGEISDIKARKIISNVYAPQTYKLLNSDYIPMRIKEIRPVGKKHVYDMEVDGTHNYVANWLITHNCIAKKHADEMNELEPKLIDGLKNKGWNRDQISEIWELLKKQSSYCFNAGHATAYGLLSYLTAYLKVHYPLYFMAALLTSKSDKVEKISPIIADCRRMGISVLPPQINKSNREFTPIPEKNEILFGLLAIKGLGGSIVDKIMAERPYSGLKDFIERVNDKTAIITLIKCGAVPVRSKMQALYKYAKYIFPKREYKPVSTLPTYKQLLIKWDIDKDDYLLPDGKKVDKDRLLTDYNTLKKKEYDEAQKTKFTKHMNDFKKKYASDEYLWEFDTLSMFITNDPLKDAYKYITYHWDDVVENTETVILTVIINIKRKKDKHGNQYAYVDLYTPDGIIEGTIWSKQLKDYADIIKKGNCLSMLGRKNDNHFFASQIKPYKQWVADRDLGFEF